MEFQEYLKDKSLSEETVLDFIRDRDFRFMHCYVDEGYPITEKILSLSMFSLPQIRKICGGNFVDKVFVFNLEGLRAFPPEIRIFSLKESVKREHYAALAVKHIYDLTGVRSEIRVEPNETLEQRIRRIRGI